MSPILPFLQLSTVTSSSFFQEEKENANHPNDDFDVCGDSSHCQNFDDSKTYSLVEEIVVHVIINSLGKDRTIIVLH